ncbi:MAG: cohesin domain-containing protein [Halobacteriota archaeon]
MRERKERKKKNRKEEKGRRKGVKNRMCRGLKGRTRAGTGLTMVAIALALCVFAEAALAAQISVVPAYQEVTKGETFTIGIYIDPEGNETAGADFILRFNNTLLNATSLSNGTFFNGFDTDNTYGEGINNTTGTVDYCEVIWPYTGKGVTTPGTLTTITFKAIAEEDGVGEVGFTKVTLSDTDGRKISTNVSNGIVSVKTGICSDVDGLPGVTTNDGRQIFMHLLYGTEQYPLADLWAADCDGLCDGITTNDGRQIFMNLLYGSEQYSLNCC